ncbi:anaerobic ribonucleoside-triphosphate reductase activating protein [Candidatus Microgenomates bacterium]|nr:anaerobic ribonucleoside-triphosphate reductase activating protein [Candidatus Microgenomates bacterium]
MSSIRGLQKTTLIDYPGKIACVIFFSNCNFRCPFCHNKDLVLESNDLPRFSEQEIFAFLKSRQKILEGVVLTGGEPTLYPNLKKFVEKITKLGFLVKLDTNGLNSKGLKQLVNQRLLDYVAMDFKGPINKYSKIVNAKVNTKAIKESMRFLVSSSLPYEFRTTVVPGIHKEADILKMAEELKNVTRYKLHVIRINWFLQQFRPGSCLNEEFNKIKPYAKSFYDKILPRLNKIIPNTFIRGV